MKVCPVCNESFGNELNFCDVDGVRLKRERVEGEAGSQNKLWQFLGVGLLLGALVLSVISVFLPTSRVATVTTSSEPTPSSGSRVQTPAQQPTPEPAREAVSDLPAITTEEIALSETRKKEKPLAVPTETNGKASPDPKAAALDAAEISAPAPSVEEPKAPVDPPNKTEVTTKSVSDSRESELTPKPAVVITERAETKKSTAAAKPTAKDSKDKKKSEEKGKEKKGGFLRVFKKIFGKN